MVVAIAPKARAVVSDCLFVTTCSRGDELQGSTPRVVDSGKVRIPQVSEQTDHCHNGVLHKELVLEDCGQ